MRPEIAWNRDLFAQAVCGGLGGLKVAELAEHRLGRCTAPGKHLVVDLLLLGHERQRPGEADNGVLGPCLLPGRQESFSGRIKQQDVLECLAHQFVLESRLERVIGEPCCPSRREPSG